MSQRYRWPTALADSAFSRVRQHAAWPIFVEPWLWIAGPFQSGSRLLRLDRERPESYADVWQSKVLSNDVFSSVCEQGFVYGFDIRNAQAKAHRPSRGKFRCIELTTGEEKWSTDKIGHAAAIGADGKLFLLTDQGELILIRADAKQFQELARSQILGGEISWTLRPYVTAGSTRVTIRRRSACMSVAANSWRSRSPVDSALWLMCQFALRLAIGQRFWELSQPTLRIFRAKRGCGDGSSSACRFSLRRRSWR